MQNVMLIGIDPDKHSFHVHCQDEKGHGLLLENFSRTHLTPFLRSCKAVTVVIASCGGTHFVARRIAGLGHEAKLISPQFVRPFVRSNKNDLSMPKRSARRLPGLPWAL